MIGIRSAFSIRARGQRPLLEAVYMTAPRFTCRNTKNALAERGPSIHDVLTYFHDPAARCARIMRGRFAPCKIRARGMPGARCTRSLVCKGRKHTSVVTTVAPEHPAFPHAMVLTAASCSPRRSGFLVTVASRIPPQSLTPASRRQDHTTSPSASPAPLSKAQPASTAFHPASVTIAIRPCMGTERRESLK